MRGREARSQLEVVREELRALRSRRERVGGEFGAAEIRVLEEKERYVYSVVFLARTGYRTHGGLTITYASGTWNASSTISPAFLPSRSSEL